MSYLLSIVVPTKNRYFYLKHLVNLIDSFNSNDIELVIQDNSDDNSEILDFIAQKERKHLKYFYSNEKLTMSGNSDLAVFNSTGEYVCFIGDDDGVCRNITDCVKWMKENQIDVVNALGAYYYWGDYKKSKYRVDVSSTAFNQRPQPLYKYADPVIELKKLMKKGFENRGTIPVLYTGIVRQEVLQEIYNIGGTYFPGGSPDMSNGVCLCFYAKKYAILDLPIIITGTSQNTGGGITDKKGNDFMPINKVSFISQDVIDNWEKNIPPLWCGKFAWTDSGIKALRYIKRTDFISNMNYDYMFALVVVYYRKLRLAFKFTPNKILLIYYVLTIFISKVLGFLRRKYFKSSDTILQNGIKDIIEAEQFFVDQMEGMGFKDLKEINK
jgi:glycosyltransferase involved in cell wall biosynthesis